MQRQAAKPKKKKAEIQQIEAETSLTEIKVDPVEEKGIDTNPSVEHAGAELCQAQGKLNLFWP